jgi:hypothetical protein
MVSNYHVLTEILREQWGYKYYTIVRTNRLIGLDNARRLTVWLSLTLVEQRGLRTPS